MIDAQGKNLGVISREAALALVQPELGLDLIEIAPAAKPPVARLMSFDKYRYEREKADKKERVAQKAAGVKRVQISVRAAHNDLLTKLRKLEEFLEAGHQVEVYLRLRGREKRNQDWARLKLEEFLKMVTVGYKLISPPRGIGNGIIAQIAKK